MSLTLSNGEKHPLVISGFVSVNPKSTTSDRQMWFLNKRPCILAKWSRVFNQVYRTVFPGVNQPFLLLNISTAEGFDLNVTPDKRTIFLAGEEELLLILRERLFCYLEPFRGALPTCAKIEHSLAEPRPRVLDVPDIHSHVISDFISSKKAIELWKSDRTLEVNIDQHLKRGIHDADQRPFKPKRFRFGVLDDIDDVEKEFNQILNKEDLSSFCVIGQFNLGFIVASSGADLFIIDQVSLTIRLSEQHASDEKCTFERLLSSFRPRTQNLISFVATLVR